VVPVKFLIYCALGAANNEVEPFSAVCPLKLDNAIVPDETFANVRLLNAPILRRLVAALPISVLIWLNDIELGATGKVIYLAF